MTVKANGREFYAKEEAHITLELSREAAHALMYVLGSVGGNMRGRRSYTDAIYYALKESGLDTSDYQDIKSGDIFFKD